MSDTPVVGKFYKIVHSRKGTFYGKVVSIGGKVDDPDMFMDVEVTSGIANAIMNYNVGYPGDVIGIRNSHTLLYEVTEDVARGTEVKT